MPFGWKFSRDKFVWIGHIKFLAAKNLRMEE